MAQSMTCSPKFRKEPLLSAAWGRKGRKTLYLAFSVQDISIVLCKSVYEPGALSVHRNIN
jgi:hypothetical protein